MRIFHLRRKTFPILDELSACVCCACVVSDTRHHSFVDGVIERFALKRANQKIANQIEAPSFVEHQSSLTSFQRANSERKWVNLFVYVWRAKVIGLMGGREGGGRRRYFLPVKNRLRDDRALRRLTRLILWMNGFLRLGEIKIVWFFYVLCFYGLQRLFTCFRRFIETKWGRFGWIHLLEKSDGS